MAEHAMDENQDQGLLARWRRTEPLRLWLYGIAVPLLAALVGYALLTDHKAALWLAVVQAVLLGGGTEAARGFVVSPATSDQAAYVAALQTANTGDETHDRLAAEEAARYVRIRYRIPS